MKKTAFLAALAMSGLSFPVFSAGGVADQVNVVEAYVRMAPPAARTTGAFMTVKNGGDRDTQIISAASAVAKTVELHNHINDNGVMRMRHVKEIPLPAKGEARLSPGGYHVMLIDMLAPIKENEHVVITLGFADGSKKEVHAVARKSMPEMPAKAMEHGKHH